MKINYCSDLHVEINGNFFSSQNKKFTPADVLVLAGDIFSAAYIHPKRTDADGKRVKAALGYLRDKVFPNFDHVLMVVGNHEYYDHSYNECRDTIKEYFLDTPKFTLLENEFKKIDDVVFVGCSFWTNYDRKNPITMQVSKDFMNDYRWIWKSSYEKLPYEDRLMVNLRPPVITPEFIYKQHLDSLQFIKDSCKVFKEEKIVVITHHPASLQCLNRKHSGNGLDGAFASDYEDFIMENPQIKSWISGHTHHPADFTVGETRMVSNPCGYRGELTYPLFQGDKVIEV